MKKGILISIRNKSARLPEKSFIHIGHFSSVEFLILRIQSSFPKNEIVIATSKHIDDEVFEAVAKKLGVKVFRGSEDDKLERYLDCVRQFKLDASVVIDGDDLFISTSIIKDMLSHQVEPHEVLLVNNNLPLGMAPYFFTSTALDQIVKVKTILDTEVWGDIVKTTKGINVLTIDPPNYLKPFSEFRLTLDYSDDLVVMNRIWRLLSEKITFSDEELMIALGKLEAGYVELMHRANNEYSSNIELVKTRQNESK